MTRNLARAVIAGTLTFGSISAAGFLPLDFGNTWTYRNSETGEAFTMRVGSAAVVNGKVYQTLFGYVGSDVLVRIDESKNVVYLDNDTNEERTLLSLIASDDAWTRAPFRACDQESQTQSKRATYGGPAGDFENVLDVRFRGISCPDAGTADEQFAENIGMLRRIETTFTGPKQYDLVYARVGNMVIEALPTGRFSVTLDATQGSDPVTVAMRLRSNFLPVKLSFPSAQEFEVVLSDEDGNVVWKWSDGNFFDQTAHQRTVTGEWSIAVPMPRPGTPSADASSKNYTLQAWLTTDGPAPRFAATVQVPILSPVTR